MGTYSNKSNKKLIVRIKGGLGNQLYCYAAARRLSIANQAELVIDNVSGFIRDFEYKNQYRLDCFSVPVRLATPNERLEPFERPRRAFLKYFSKLQSFENRKYLEQEFPEFDSRLLNVKLKGQSTIIDGLWQSENYFKDIEETIRKDFFIPSPKDEQNLKAQQWIRQNEAIAIHVRWFAPPGGITQPVSTNVTPNYYYDAIEKIKGSIKNPHFAVFSDKPEAAAKLLNLPIERSLLVNWNSHERGEIADFWLMTQCKHYILANSTFSWWGAWLGTNDKNQIVIFPRNASKHSLHWAWDYDGQMLPHWIPIHVIK